MKKIDNITDLKTLVVDALRKAAHHAQEVEQIIPTVLGCILCYGDDISTKYNNADEAYGNVVWFKMNNKQFCLAYSHKTKNIELRNRTQKGEAIYSFNNSTPNIEDCFISAQA